MKQHPENIPPPRPAQELPEWLLRTAESIAAMNYGQITLTVHQGEVVELQKTERIRFATARKSA